jgi:ubiquinone/menaquinone biosynthesis C-methylase UbiE
LRQVIDRRFHAEASRYDAAYDAAGAAGRALRDRMDTVLELAGDAGGEALDAGMGAGRLLVALERRGWRVSGVDVSDEMVTLARNRLPHASGRLVRGRIEELPFAAEGFDLVVATGVLEYADDLDAAIAELARTVRPGGRAIVSLPNWWSGSLLVRRHLLYPAARHLPHRGRQAPPPPKRLIRSGTFERLLVQAGLAPTAVRLTSFRPRALRWLGFRSLAAQIVFATERRTA